MAAPPGLPLVLLLAALSFLHLLSGGAADDLSSDRAALLALRADLGGRTLSWNISSPSPCSWLGVICSGRRVTELRLPGAGLAGSIRVGTAGKLTALRSLSLRFNRLSGPLPSDLSALANLYGLYLNGNAFTGGIPGTLFSLSNLARINLAGNNLTGGISPAFNTLTQLVTLLLEDNQLSGEIPPFNLTQLVEFNVSNNNLIGSIPPTLRTMPTTAFLGNHLCSRPLRPCSDVVSPALSPGPSSDNSNTKNGESSIEKSKLPAKAIAAIAIGAAGGALLLLFLFLVLFFQQDGKNKTSLRGAAADGGVAKPRDSEVSLHDKPAIVEKATQAVAQPTFPIAATAAPAPVVLAAGGNNRKLVFPGRVHGFYDLEDLLKASAEVLGKGTTGTTYKAMLEMSTVVAVKRLRDMNLPEKEFREKITMIGNMDHPNLVALQAYYFSKDEKLLVYEFVPNGSLSSLLHGNKGSGKTPLDWETRLNIAIGSARGIEYIHSKDPNGSHGNIKSSNILLGRSFEPRVSDSGTSSLAASPTPSRAAAGYRAPEITDIRKVSHKADVYSFGVVLLELLTGKAPSSTAPNDEGVDLPRWVQSIVQEEWTSEVFDSELTRMNQNVEEEIVKLLQLAIECVGQIPQNRPSMSQVASRIEEIQSSSLTDRQNSMEGDDFDQSSEQTSVSGYRPLGNEF